MNIRRKINACGLLVMSLLSFSATPAFADKRPWNAERYSACLTTTGTDQLAPDLIVSSQGCRSGRDPVESDEDMPSGTKAVAWVSGARNKDDQKLTFVAIAFGTMFERSSTFVGGSTITNDAGGGIKYSSVYAMVGGHRQELTASFLTPSPPTCSHMRRGALSMTSCSYSNGGLVSLPDKLLDELDAQYVVDPLALFRFRLETTSGSITYTIPIAEITAVRRAIWPPASS